jgi:hypothetical protein
MKKKGIRMFTGLMAVSLLFLMTSSCQKEYKVSDLLGTWAYQDNTQYTITFREDGTMGYTAPVSAPSYTPTYTLDGFYIYVRVIVGSATISDVVEIRSLNPTTLVVYYDGDLLFDGQSLNGEYTLLKR